MDRFNLNKPPKRDGWFKRLTTLFGGVIPFVFVVLGSIWGIHHCTLIRTGNDACDKKCIAKGYPAGEIASPREWKHDVCVCWPGSPSPPAYFLLKRSD